MGAKLETSTIGVKDLCYKSQTTKDVVWLSRLLYPMPVVDWIIKIDCKIGFTIVFNISQVFY